MMDEITGFDKLRKIGAQKLHEDTHIPKEYTNALLAQKFDNMNKIQFIGFISILEREYTLELDKLKENGLAYFIENTNDSIAPKVFVAPKTKNNNTIYYILGAMLIFGLVALWSLSESSKVAKKDAKVDNTTIQTAALVMKPKLEIEPIVEVPKEKVVIKSFKILPKSKLWVGYINLDTGKKFQKTFSDELNLNPNGHWLLTFGHGNVNFDINGEIDEYKSAQNIRFVYKDGVLKKITYKEFLGLNKGQKW